METKDFQMMHESVESMCKETVARLRNRLEKVTEAPEQCKRPISSIMGKSNTIQNESPAKALDFGRAIQNLIIPLPELVGLCVESKAVLMDLMDLTDDSEEIEGIKFVNFTLSLLADFIGDALDEEAAKKTAFKRTRDLMKFREHLKEIFNNK